MASKQQLVVESFKYGRDTRRSYLTSVPGTLVTAENGHITQGGAFQKRLAFVPLTRAVGSNSLPANTFGLQRTATGLLVFGSDDLASESFPATPTWPAAVSYQRLQHPAVLAGTTYSAGSHAMTAVVHSDLYGGYAFVIAQFADSSVYCYYNGTPVYDVTNGRVLSWVDTTVKLATQIVAEVNRTDDYNATQVVLTPLTHVRASNVVTITVASTSYLRTGTRATITGFSNTTYNKTDVTLTVVNATTFTYPCVETDDGGTGTLGIVTTGNFILTGADGVDYSVEDDITSTAGTIDRILLSPATGQPEDALPPSTASFKIIHGSEGDSPVEATGSITINGTNVSNNDYIQIGTFKYTFKTTIVQDPLNIGHVKIGATAADTLTNLKNAINYTASPGNYYVVSAHINVRASIAGSVMTLTAFAGTTGNSVTITFSANVTAIGWTKAAFSAGAGNAIGAVTAYGFISTGNVRVELLGDPVGWTTSNEATALAVANEINDNTEAGLAHGYKAESEGNQVFVTATDDASMAPDGFNIEVAVGGNVQVNTAGFALNLTGGSFTVDDISAKGISLITAASFSYPGSYTSMLELYNAIVSDINDNSGDTNCCAFADNQGVHINRILNRSNDTTSTLGLYVQVSAGAGVSQTSFANNCVAFTPSLQPKTYLVLVKNAWVVGDTWKLHFQTGTVTTTIGNGLLAGVSPTFVFTFNKKEYLLAGPTFFFSAVDEPTVFNDANGIGNGYVDTDNSSGTMGSLVAAASYQGKLALLGRNVAQIWNTDPDPANYLLVQTLENVGTIAKLSVKSVGDLDIYMLSDSGFRAIRVRDASSNAASSDVGTAIDSVVQAALSTMTEADKALSCGAVDPSANRYWCFVKDTIYVRSDFRESGVQAWSNYKPEYYPSGVQTAFVPSRIEVLNGRVYLRAGVNIFLYGGAAGTVYDESVATLETYYMDAKNAAAEKLVSGIDAAFTGAWAVSLGCDPASGTLDTVYSNTEATYWNNLIPVQQRGTHLKVKAVTTGSAAATFDAFSIHFSQGETT